MGRRRWTVDGPLVDRRAPLDRRWIDDGRSVFISYKDIGFKLALKCVDASNNDSNHGQKGNFRIEDLFVPKADGCTLYETEPGVKSIFETPHPYIYGRVEI